MRSSSWAISLVAPLTRDLTRAHSAVLSLVNDGGWSCAPTKADTRSKWSVGT